MYVEAAEENKKKKLNKMGVKMGMKMTRKKKESEARGWKEHREYLDNINKLEGKEKLEYEIDTLKSQIKNVELDCTRIKSIAIENKLNILKEQLKEKEKEYENCID